MIKGLNLVIVAAVGTDGVIGSKGALPWSIQSEYAHYRNLICGQTVIIGRTSYEIFKNDLEMCRTIVLSRSKKEIPGVLKAQSPTEAIKMAQILGETAICLGGAEVYEQLLPYAGHMMLSQMKGSYVGDAWFPGFDVSEWSEASIISHQDFDFYTYERINAS